MRLVLQQERINCCACHTSIANLHVHCPDCKKDVCRDCLGSRRPKMRCTLCPAEPQEAGFKWRLMRLLDDEHLQRLRGVAAEYGQVPPPLPGPMAQCVAQLTWLPRTAPVAAGVAARDRDAAGPSAAGPAAAGGAGPPDLEPAQVLRLGGHAVPLEDVRLASVTGDGAFDPFQQPFQKKDTGSNTYRLHAHDEQRSCMLVEGGACSFTVQRDNFIFAPRAESLRPGHPDYASYLEVRTPLPAAPHAAAS